MSYEDGKLTELELPHQEGYEGYAFFLEYGQPYQSFRIYSEKLDTTIEFTNEQKQELSNDETRYESQIHNDLKNNWIGTDGINDINIVQLDIGKYALDISQYLYSGAHMNGGIGEGCSRIAWNGQEFEVVDQWFLSRWHDDKRFPE